MGLLTNYLYDKFKGKPSEQERQAAKLGELIATQEQRIKELQDLIKHEKDRHFARQATRSLKFHRQIMIKIKKNDSSIEASLKEYVQIIESKGCDAITKAVNSHWDRG